MAFNEAVIDSNSRDSAFMRGASNPWGKVIVGVATLPLVMTKGKIVSDVGKIAKSASRINSAARKGGVGAFKLSDAAAAKLAAGTFDFGKYLKGIIGGPPANMFRAHAHHILFKEGIGIAQQRLVREGQRILRRYGIDPILGQENLVWASNIKRQHTIKVLEPIVDDLQMLEATGASRARIERTLAEFGEIAANRTEK